MYTITPNCTLGLFDFLFRKIGTRVEGFSTFLDFCNSKKSADFHFTSITGTFKKDIKKIADKFIVVQRTNAKKEIENVNPFTTGKK